MLTLPWAVFLFIMMTDIKVIFRYSFLAVAISSVSSAAMAATWSFDPSLLNNGGRDADISVFEQGGQLPGIYPVDILLNGEHIDFRDVAFHQEEDERGQLVLKSCLTRKQLTRYGVKVEAWPALFPASGGKKGSAGEQCARLSAIADATEVLRFNSQQLLLSIPQVALRPKQSGIAPRELWDDGIPAFLMNYRTNAVRSEYRGAGKSVSDAFYAQLEPGANLGPWRLRNLTTWQKQNGNEGKWQTAWTYAERGLYDQKSRLTLGDRYTSSDIFDSVPFRGAMLASDEQMVPWNQREFAPVVRGVAHTQARVEVRQSGYVIYTTMVAPGAFALTDLQTTGSNGELQVTVTESDGRTQTFTVPVTTPAIALREGYLKYGVMAGRYRSSEPGVSETAVGQATLMYGLPWGLTVYGGLQGAEPYQAGALGVGASLGAFGAVSLDGVLAEGKKQGEDTSRGQTWRVRWSKIFEETNTGFSLASYQYASSGFSSLPEVLDSYHRNETRNTHGGLDRERRRARTTLTLSQSLDSLGYLYLTGARESYWNRPQYRDEITGSWSSSFRNISWSLNWTERQVPRWHDSHHPQRSHEQEFSLWFSLPLAQWTGGNTRATYQMMNGNHRDTWHELGLNGDALDRQLHWDVRERMTPDNQTSNSSLMNLSWYGTYGQANGGYSYSPSSRQVSAGLAGGMVVHRHGVTAGQPLGQSVALVEAPDVSGVSAGGPGVRTDFRGYTTVGWLSPYQENVVSLDPSTLPSDAEIPQTDRRVVPTAGAVIPATFATRTGGRAVIALTRADGSPVPFGAVVSLTGQEKNHNGSGITGNGGKVYMSGLPETGTLRVSWGNNRQCQAQYRLPSRKGPAGVYTLGAKCLADSAPPPLKGTTEEGKTG